MNEAQLAKLNELLGELRNDAGDNRLCNGDYVSDRVIAIQDWANDLTGEDQEEE